jgi:hypothetical protein
MGQVNQLLLSKLFFLVLQVLVGTRDPWGLKRPVVVLIIIIIDLTDSDWGCCWWLVNDEQEDMGWKQTLEWIINYLLMDTHILLLFPEKRANFKLLNINIMFSISWQLIWFLRLAFFLSPEENWEKEKLGLIVQCLCWVTYKPPEVIIAVN